MATQNCIALHLPASLGFPQTGLYWLPVPADGVPADLLQDVAPYLDSCREDYRGKSLTVTAPTWEAVRVAVEATRAERAEEARVAAERRAAVGAKWRASAAKYLAGENVSSTFYSDSVWLEGANSSASEVAADEIAAVRAESARRDAVRQAEIDAAKQAQAAALMEVLPRILAGDGLFAYQSVKIGDVSHELLAAGREVEAQLRAEKQRRADAIAAADAAAIAELAAGLDEATRTRREAGYCTDGQWREILARAASRILKDEIATLGVVCGGPAYVSGTSTRALTDAQYAVAAPLLAYAREHGIVTETCSVYDSEEGRPCENHEECDDDCEDCATDRIGRRAILKLSRKIGSLKHEGDVTATTRVELGHY